MLHNFTLNKKIYLSYFLSIPIYQTLKNIICFLTIEHIYYETENILEDFYGRSYIAANPFWA